MTVRIVFIRHSRSCANYHRDEATTDEHVTASQMIRDPLLTEHGAHAARAYGPVLARRLRQVADIDVATAVVGASRLRRAQQTAALLFGRPPRIYPSFAENGAIPENTPVGESYEAPDMSQFLDAVVSEGIDRLVIVGHGSFLRSVVWPTFAGLPLDRMRNLDAFVVDVYGRGPKGWTGRVVAHIPYSGKPMDEIVGDRCRMSKIGGNRRDKMPTTRKHRDTRKNTHVSKKRHQQRGGATPMPLAYYQPGAQMAGTRGYETGVGLAQPEAGWVRAPLGQTGGWRRRLQGQGQGQAGGFTPMVMGSFAESGMRLLPVATYMGYKMLKNQRRTRRRHSGRR